MRYSLGWTVMGPMEDQKGYRSCSVNFVHTRESQLTQEGVHPNIGPFEHLCNETFLDRETGLMEGKQISQGSKRKLLMESKDKTAMKQNIKCM